MRSYTKLLFVALLAALAMGTVAGTATALRSISITNGTVFTYGGRYTFTNEAGEFRVICTVLRTITFLSSAIAKTEGVQVGTASLALRECSGGTVRILQPNPWKIFYKSFTGTLPTIRTIKLAIEPNRGGFLLEVFFGIARCLYGGNVSGIANVNATNEVNEVRAEESSNVATVNLGGVECPPGVLRGVLTPLGEPIKIRLV